MSDAAMLNQTILRSLSKPMGNGVLDAGIRELKVLDTLSVLIRY